MKVILTGSTGYIGREVLNECLRTPAITSVIALSRRDLPEAATNTKLIVIIVEDFNSYPDELIEHLKSADACIWSMGTYNWDPVVELEYPEAFQTALLKVLDDKKTFRYVYLGGAFTEEDQERTLWFYSEGRRVRGFAQTKFLEFGKQNSNVATHVVRPAGVLPRGSNALLRSLLWKWVVGNDELAATMVDLAINGGTEQMVLNKDIVERGREVLSKR